MKMDPDIIALLPAEISIMKKCQHENIVTYYGSYMIDRDSLWVNNNHLFTYPIFIYFLIGCYGINGWGMSHRFSST